MDTSTHLRIVVVFRHLHSINHFRMIGVVQSVAKFRSLINSFKASVNGTECYSLESFRFRSRVLSTARCEAERDNATCRLSVRTPSVCDVQVP